MTQYFIVATAIIVRNGTYLITQRSASEEKFPGQWTVPGGTLEPKDYEDATANQAGIWYNVLEKLVAREVKEETNLDIANIRYLVSLVYQKKAGPALCLSLLADYVDGDIALSDEMQAHAWVTVDNAHEHGLIPGILEELYMADDMLHGRPVKEWAHYEARALHAKKAQK